MDFYNQVIDMDGVLLLFENGECEGAISTSWVEKDSTGIRFKNEFGQMIALATDKCQRIAFKRNCAIFAEDIILLK